MDGFGVMEEIRLRALLPRVPVVFLTAAQDRALLLRAFEAAADDPIGNAIDVGGLHGRVLSRVTHAPSTGASSPPVPLASKRFSRPASRWS